MDTISDHVTFTTMDGIVSFEVHKFPLHLRIPHYLDLRCFGGGQSRLRVKAHEVT